MKPKLLKSRLLQQGDLLCNLMHYCLLHAEELWCRLSFQGS